MAKSSHVPHIKRYTAGTSNELSFDVLDAKRDKLDAQQKRKRKKGFMLDFRYKPKESGGSGIASKAAAATSSAGKGAHRRVASNAIASSADAKLGRTKGSSISSGPTLVSSGNPLIPVDEVIRRKKARRRRSLRNYAILAVVVVVAIGAAGWFAYNNYRAQEDFGSQFNLLVEQVAAADPALVEIDDMMDDPLGATTDEQRALARKRGVGVTSTSDHVKATAESLRAAAPAEQDRMAIDQIIEGAKGRVSLIGLAMETFDVVDDASSARKAAETAWDMVVDTDIAARDAISASNGATTASALEEATGSLRVAHDEFGAALQQLMGIESMSESIDLSQQKTYVEKRIEALEYALATNEALAAGDRQGAAKQNDLYEAADKESASLAEKLPQSIGDTIDAAYTDNVRKVQARYDTQRKRVVEADSLVREYIRG